MKVGIYCRIGNRRQADTDALIQDGIESMLRPNRHQFPMGYFVGGKELFDFAMGWSIRQDFGFPDLVRSLWSNAYCKKERK
ncbi:MAG: hypothetical protein C0621_07950 [Desulfuromonas sp.]|nr:MAG: hypothetical protein C0621_07950 [Desulfuromonas sp.]